MKTDIISVSSRGNQIGSALEQVEKVAAYKGLSGKQALHLRLLTEEMMGMMRSITGKTEGQFWIEDRDGEYQLHLRVNTRLNSEKREQLLSASTSGKNEASRGFMGRLRSFFEPYYGVPMFTSGFVGGGSPQMYGSYVWSMEDYREQLRQYSEQNQADSKQEWDELEKSVVANIADNVKVSIRGREAEMAIYKKLA